MKDEAGLVWKEFIHGCRTQARSTNKNGEKCYAGKVNWRTKKESKQTDSRFYIARKWLGWPGGPFQVLRFMPQAPARQELPKWRSEDSFFSKIVIFNLEGMPRLNIRAISHFPCMPVCCCCWKVNRLKSWEWNSLTFAQCHVFVLAFAYLYWLCWFEHFAFAHHIVFAMIHMPMPGTTARLVFSAVNVNGDVC